MNLVDYREQLGIGFNDNEKFEILKNKTLIFIDEFEEENLYNENSFVRYNKKLGFRCDSSDFYYGLRNNFLNTKSVKDLIFKFIVFSNTYMCDNPWGISESDYSTETLINVLKNFLDDLNISFDVIKDEDGYFVFPKGAKELDDALVSAPLNWLKPYPKAHTAFVKALKSYSEATDENASDIADLFRKALETFFQEFFNETKSLENMLSIYGNYLKDKGVPAEIANNFQKLLEQYCLYNNNFAKHHDKTSKNVLEYILYQTGNTIRLLITL